MSATAAALTNQSFYVTIATAKGSTTKRIDGDALSVGRAEDCQLSILHETLSRRHMSVLLRNGQCWIEDHGSANGTFVNGRRIAAHAPVRVNPEDQVVLGQSEVRLSASVEPMVRKEGVPDISDTLITTTATQRRHQRLTRTVPDARSGGETQAEVERLMQEALKKSATIVQEAEFEAERRVEDIYRRAHETQAKMDEAYHHHLNEAYRAAEDVFQKSQGEVHSMMVTARQRSMEIRSQAEGFVSELRRRTEEDCERILAEAQQTARELKENRLQEAEDLIRRKEEDLVEQTRVAMNSRLTQFEDSLAQEADRQRRQLEEEARDRREALDKDLQSTTVALQKAQAEYETLNNDVLKHTEKLKKLETSIEAQTQRALALREEIAGNQKAKAEMQAVLGSLGEEIDRLAKDRDAAKEQLGLMQQKNQSLKRKFEQAEADFEAELARLKARFDDERSKIFAAEKQQMEERKLEVTRKVKELEQQLIEEIHEKRERLGREIGLNVEAYFKERQGGEAISFKDLQGEIHKHLERQIVTLSQDPTAKGKQQSLIALRRWERARVGLMGLIVGMSAMWLGLRAHTALKSNFSPMAQRVVNLQEERKADLERRKFNPAQTAEVRSTYTDNVIYMQGFTAKYLSEDFQRQLLRALSPYMLKTWRVDEEKVIHLLATSTALVKTLAERKENIHPDFVPQGIEKMKDLERESLSKMRQILGTNVRVESFRKFERQFLEKQAGRP